MVGVVKLYPLNLMKLELVSLTVAQEKKAQALDIVPCLASFHDQVGIGYMKSPNHRVSYI